MSKINLEKICVDYPIYGESYNSLRRKLISFTTGGLVFKDQKNNSVVRGLNNISFSLDNGDRLGIIGHNGAGKSTLLKTLGGFLTPVAGKIEIIGNTRTVFSVCSGMDIERNGYDNIKYMGVLLGLTNKQINDIIPDVEEFTELGEFLNMPVRTYSDGMKMRLGFAITTALTPEILLLDEAIGVGDASFVEKAAARTKSFYDKASIIILTSHSTAIIKEFCNKVLWLEKGHMKMFGNIEDIIPKFEELYSH